MKIQKTEIGTCILCNEKGRRVTFIDDKAPICDECLQYLGHCDKCGEYWCPEDRSFYHLKDGKVLCEICAEGTPEEQIEYIEC